MGTPGDKTKIGEVVQGGAQLDPDRAEIVPTTTTTTARTIVTTAVDASSRTTAALSSTDMGQLHRYHQTPFETRTALNLQPSLTSQIHAATATSSKSAETSSSSSTFHSVLEQAHIEDYFTQTKYYPSASENLTLSASSTITSSSSTSSSQLDASATTPQKQSTKTFLSLDQPGPSGLQYTPKSKSIPKINVKQRKKQSSTSASQKKPYTCTVCQKSFVTIERLSKHQQVHSGASPFKCENCKKSFSSKFKLVRHVLIHSDRKPFSCSVCERTFHRKDHLKNHIKVHSPSKEIYVCKKPDCKKEYSSLMSYRKHLALHAAEDGSLECQICSSVFPTKEDIMYHLKIHAGSRTVKNPNDKKFTCDECGRKFFTKKDVRRHLVVHTGMRDFLCQFCPQRFGRKDHLVRHIKKSHSKNVRAEDIETAIKVELPETVVKPEEDIKPEPEFSESSSLSNTEFNFTFNDFDQLTPFLQTTDPDVTLPFLPSTSTQDDLKDLCSEILEDIGEPSSAAALATDPSNVEILSQNVLNNPDLLVVQPSEKTKPLPGFSQTFQSPPPPP